MTEPGLVSKESEWAHKGTREKSFYLSEFYFLISERRLKTLASSQHRWEHEMGGGVTVLHTCYTKKAITEDTTISTVSDEPNDQIWATVRVAGRGEWGTFCGCS